MSPIKHIKIHENEQIHVVHAHCKYTVITKMPSITTYYKHWGGQACMSKLVVMVLVNCNSKCRPFAMSRPLGHRLDKWGSSTFKCQQLIQ